MRCVQLVSPFSSLRLSTTEKTPSINAPNFLWSANEDQTVRLRPNILIMPVAVNTGCRVFGSEYVISATQPPQSPDPSVLLPVSAALLLLYWVANFVVPDILIKDFQSDDTKDVDNKE